MLKNLLISLYLVLLTLFLSCSDSEQKSQKELFASLKSDSQLKTIVQQPRHIKSIMSVSFSPDGKFVVTASSDETAKLWDVETGVGIHTFKGHSSDINSIDFSPEGKYVVTGSNDSTAKLWDISTGKEIRSFKGHSPFYTTSDKTESVCKIYDARFSPDGKYVVTAGSDKTARLWDVRTGKEIQTFSGHSLPVKSVEFSPDGNYIVTGSNDGTIKMWDVKTGKEISSMEVVGSYYINSVSVSPDGKYIAVGIESSTIYIKDKKYLIKLFNILTGKVINTFIGHTNKINTLCFSPDGKYIVSGSDDQTTKLWILETGKEIRTFNHTSGVTAVDFSPDGRYIVTGSRDSSARLFNINDSKEIQTLLGRNFDYITSLSYSPNEKNIIIGIMFFATKLWELKTNKITLLKYYPMYFSPDGNYILAVEAFSNDIKLLNANNFKEICTLTGHTGYINCISFNSDGNYFVSSSDDKTAKLWDIKKCKKIRTFIGHNNRVVSISYSPNDEYIITGSADSTAKLWDVATCKEIRTFSGYSSSIWNVGFSSDGKHIIIGDGSNTELINYENNNKVNFFNGSFKSNSPDGKYIITKNKDSIFKIWDIISSDEIMTLKQYNEIVSSIDFSPNSKYIITGSLDGTIKLWEVNTGRELATLISIDNDWVIITPEGYFDASEDAKSYIYFVKDLEVFKSSQLYNHFYKPNILSSLMGGN